MHQSITSIPPLYFQITHVPAFPALVNTMNGATASRPDVPSRTTKQASAGFKCQMGWTGEEVACGERRGKVEVMGAEAGGL